MFETVLVGVAATALIGLVTRRMYTRRRENTRQADRVDLVLEPSGRTRTAARPIQLNRSGSAVLGRGSDTYAVDPCNPFFACVSRKHMLVDVLPTGVYISSCTNRRGGESVVDLEGPFGGMVRLTARQQWRIEPGSQIFLGSHPAPGYTERPGFVVKEVGDTLVSNPLAREPATYRDDTLPSPADDPLETVLLSVHDLSDLRPLLEDKLNRPKGQDIPERKRTPFA